MNPLQKYPQKMLNSISRMVEMMISLDVPINFIHFPGLQPAGLAPMAASVGRASGHEAGAGFGRGTFSTLLQQLANFNEAQEQETRRCLKGYPSGMSHMVCWKIRKMPHLVI